MAVFLDAVRWEIPLWRRFGRLLRSSAATRRPPGGELPEELRRDVGVSAEYLDYGPGAELGRPARLHVVAERAQAGLQE